METLQTLVVQPLQPILRPVAEALPQPIHDAVVSLVGAHCHRALVVDLDLTEDPACTSLAISKVLGMGIVGASAIVKVPQILKLVSSRSSAGVSFVSYALETASLLITLSYGVRNRFPFSTYGESAFIAIQDIVVGILVLNFAGKSAAAAAFVAVVAASVYVLLFDTQLVDAQTMSYLQAGAGLLGVASKAPQIFTIWREGGTGQLSAFAVFNYLVGSLSRIFTTVQEVDDKLILYGFVAGFILNVILAAQMLYYWNSPVAARKQHKSVKMAHDSHAVAESSGVSPKGSAKSPTTRRRG